MKSYIKVVGNIDIKKFNEDGVLIDSIKYPNLVVTSGKEFIARRLASNTTNISYIAVGTDSAAAALTDTALGTELDRTNLFSNASVSGADVTFTAFFGNANAVGTFSEAGLFDSANVSNSIMVCRTVFPAYTKANNEVIAIAWTLTII